MMLIEEKDIITFYESNKTKTIMLILKLYLSQISSLISNAVSRLSKV